MMSHWGFSQCCSLFYIFRFQKLKDYKEQHGTCHVSRTVPDSELKPLARWVKTQRALYKSGKILEDRKERLESIDFVWDGTQLEIKRKRRRKSDDGEKKVKGEPRAKRGKTTDASKKAEDDEDGKPAGTNQPPVEASIVVTAVKEEGDDKEVDKVATETPAAKVEDKGKDVEDNKKMDTAQLLAAAGKGQAAKEDEQKDETTKATNTEPAGKEEAAGKEDQKDETSKPTTKDQTDKEEGKDKKDDDQQMASSLQDDKGEELGTSPKRSKRTRLPVKQPPPKTSKEEPPEEEEDEGRTSRGRKKPRIKYGS